MHTKDPNAGTNGIPEGKMLLSENTIGHGAASSAVLRVDLDNDIVVSQVRNRAGSDFDKHFVEFLRAIDQSLLDR